MTGTGPGFDGELPAAPRRADETDIVGMIPVDLVPGGVGGGQDGAERGDEQIAFGSTANQVVEGEGVATQGTGHPQHHCDARQ